MDESTPPPLAEVGGHRAWLGLGSNLGDRAAAIGAAIRALGAAPAITVRRLSRLYETPPWGDTDQGPFLNAAAEIETTLDPHALLDLCLAIEAELGRVRERRWGPRRIDIDLIHMDGVEISDDRLTLPHPHWRERVFVLVPLAEIAPDLTIGGTQVRDASQRLDVRAVRPSDAA